MLKFNQMNQNISIRLPSNERVSLIERRMEMLALLFNSKLKEGNNLKEKDDVPKR